jgi:hypothetical protein
MLSRLDTLERRLERATASAERLDHAMVELNRTVAKARVLAGAAGEAKDLVDSLRGAVGR